MLVNTKNYGKAEVLGSGTKYNYLRVRFLNTGNYGEFRKDAVEKGEIRDKFAVTLCGVGIIGDIKTRGKYKQYYNVWRNMITRCYHSNNPAYAGVVKVCERWKVFQYFYEDVSKIEGWNKSLFEQGRLVLDKDIKQRYLPNKVYSIDTCTWVSKEINSAIQDRQQRPFIAISPDGVTYVETNITDFGRRFGLERKQISAVLHGRFNTTKGWKFKFIDEEIV